MSRDGRGIGGTAGGGGRRGLEVGTRFGRGCLVLHCRTVLENSTASSVGHFEFLREAGSQLVAFFPFSKNFVVGLYSILVPPSPCIKC